jgi:hypothetical protein
MPERSFACIEVMEVRETGDLPLRTGGGLHEDEELGPEQEKRRRTETGGEKRLWEGIMMHDAHWCPSLPSRQTWTGASLDRCHLSEAKTFCQVFFQPLAALITKRRVSSNISSVPVPSSGTLHALSGKVPISGTDRGHCAADIDIR